MQDKRKTVLHLFHESAKPWLLKDVEWAARGVVFQAVKDVVHAPTHARGQDRHEQLVPSFPCEASASRARGGSKECTRLEAECAQLDEA